MSSEEEASEKSLSGDKIDKINIIQWIGFRTVIQLERILSDGPMSYEDIIMMNYLNVTEISDSFRKRPTNIILGYHRVNNLKDILYGIK